MKRMLAVFLSLIFTLSGCGKEIGENAPNETFLPFPCISVTVLAEPQDFGGFTAGPAGDAESVRLLIKSVLEEYPAGFPDQWGNVEIILCSNLTGTGHFAGGSYAGFTQQMGGDWQMVLDTDRCNAGTVHHEIAHILDGILTEAGALTESEWMAFCPTGFRYGRGDWAQYPDFFADTYAMTDIKEDRARTFEEAALFGPGVYADRPALWLKLEYFSRAIRDHFDTSDWTEEPFWEAALD